MLFRSDRKSTRLNSSHTIISYAVFCLKKKNARLVEERHAFDVARGVVARRAASHGRAFVPLARVLSGPSSTIALSSQSFFFFNNTAPTEIYPLPFHAALPI